MENFEQALNTFLAGAQKKVDDNLAEYENYPLTKKLSVDPRGKKYKRIVVKEYNAKDGKELSHTGSVYCFVNAENGDVLKAAGWKAPAKGARGNIFDANNGLKGVTCHGAVYWG